MRGNDFEEKNAVPLIFKQFWSRSYLNKFDRLTPQDIYYIQAVLDQRPKFYGRSRRFMTYGYGGRSLRPHLLPKVLLIVFPKMEAEMCFSLHRCHLRLN